MSNQIRDPRDNGFGQYGKAFQEKIMQALLTDPKWAEQLTEVFDVSYFDLKYLVYLADKYFAYAKQYKVFPSLQMLVTIIRDDLKKGNDILLRDQIIDYLQRMRLNPDPGDLPGVKAKALDFCRKQALQVALETAVEHMASEKYEQIVEVIKKAVMVGTTPSVGHEFFEDYDARFNRLARQCVATGIKELDRKDIMNGGLACGELGVIVAPTGVGKCVFSDTYINIRYTKITIEREIIEERVTMGELFDRLGFSQSVEPTDDDGDSCFDVSNFGIEVLSDAGYHPIEAIRWTKPESQVLIRLCAIDSPDVLELQCSPRHLIMSSMGWNHAERLNRGEVIVTRLGEYKVDDVIPIEDVERLCDLQVRDSHRYYTNDVLSHNSHMLTFLGANALKAGVDVLHYTFELSEASVGVRYDSQLCDINSNQIIDRKEEVKKKYAELKGLGRLFIKEYPTNSASIYTLRSHVERLLVTKGFRPGLICVDYADIMRSTRQYDSLRHELKLVYEELRAWAAEFGVPIWTASQSNKEGANSDIVDLSNMSEAYGKAMVADTIISISRKPQEKASGFGRLFMAKNRAGRDGIIWPVQIDTSTSNFNVLSQEITPGEAKESDDRDIKAKIRERWDEVKRDKMLKAKDIVSSSPPSEINEPKDEGSKDDETSGPRG